MQTLRKVCSLIAVAAAVAALGACTLQNDPRAEFSVTPQFGYPPLEVTFNAAGSTSPNGLIVEYAWDLGDGETASGVSVTHTYAEKGTYEVTLEIRDSSGKKAVRTHEVEALNHAPVARFKTNVQTTGDLQPIWFDASESYDQDGDIVEYQWDFGDGETAVGEMVSHEYQCVASGWRPTITLTVVDENGTTDSVTHQVLIVCCSSCG